MTRKDYILVTEGLRIAYLNASAEMSLRDVNGVGLAAQCVANSLQRDNPLFDSAHFMAVVRGEQPLDSKAVSL